MQKKFSSVFRLSDSAFRTKFNCELFTQKKPRSFLRRLISDGEFKKKEILSNEIGERKHLKPTVSQLFYGINIFDSPENLRMSTRSVGSPSVSAGLTLSRSRRFRLMVKPALTLGLPTPV
jgi:hypothetical protein